MRTLDSWMAEYGESHREKRNIAFHRVCVPLILWSVVGLASLARLNQEPLQSAAVPLILAALGFYAFLGPRAFFPMVLMLSSALWLCRVAETYLHHVWPLYVAVFVLGWMGQALGHALEGRKPSFLQNLQFLLIGPLWILRRH